MKIKHKLLGATLQVLADGQAVLYAEIQRLHYGDTMTDGQFEEHMQVYKDETASLILQVLETMQEEDE